MMAILDNLLGPCPAGLEFLRYLFAFILVAFGLFVIAYISHLPFEFIKNRFHK